MFAVGIAFVGLNIIGYLLLTGYAYQKQTAPRLALGLWSLGVLNMVGGIGALLLDYQLGIVPIVSGAVSAEIGSLAKDYWQKESGPNWNWHALYIGLSIFFIGLLVIA